MPIDRLLSQNAPSLINGVSRQPASQRLSSQAEIQTNMISDVAQGVLRRPPTEFIASLVGPVVGAAPSGGYATHVINRGDGEQFIVFVEDGDINVYNLTTGAEVTVTDADPTGTPGTYAYLNITPSATVDAENSFELLTVADYTFVVNKRITVAMSGSPSAGRTQAHEFLLTAKSFLQAYERTSITFGATTIVNPATGTLALEEVIDQFCAGLGLGANPSNAAGVTAGSTNWRFTRVSKTSLYGYQFQNALETVSVDFGIGDEKYLFLATSTSGDTPQTPLFSSLPYEGVDQFVVKISGTEGSDEDEYYVKYNGTKKIWEETRLPGLDNSFNPATMPHALVYAAGAFTWQPLTWDSRLVGDSLSAPQPSFVGQQIKDVTLHKQRLLFIADENVIASESGDLFNFWPTTVTTLVDSDTWDVAGTGDRVSRWDYMTNFEGNITLFSSVGDAIGEVVGADDAPLTIKNARVEERGTYAFTALRPQVLGNGIYFALDRGGSTNIFRYSKTDAYTFRADEITGHVRGYIPANVDHMKVSNAENLLVLRSRDETNALYVYRTHILNNEQVMSSWFKWTFGSTDDILNFDFIESKMYMVTRRGADLKLEVMDFGKLDEDEGVGATPLGYRVHLDSLVSITGVYSAGATIWNLPYDRISGETYKLIKGGAWGATAGESLPNILVATFGPPPTAARYIVEGDYSAFPMYFGRAYESVWQPSEAVMKSGDSSNPASSARITGRLQLYTGRVQYFDTGAFDVYVTSDEDDDEYIIPFRSQYVNQSVFGPVELHSGVFQFPIGGDSRNIAVTFRTNAFLPAGYSSYEWEGRYVQRSDSA